MWEGGFYCFKPFSFNTQFVETPVDRSMIPRPRSGHRIVCDEGYLYSFGGYNPFIDPFDWIMDGDIVWAESCPLFRELWRFSFASHTWVRLLAGHGIPMELASNAMIRSGEQLMVYGGTSVPFGASCSNSLFVHNLKSDTVMHRVDTKGIHPRKQYGQALVLHGKFLYTIGGTTGYDYDINIYRLDLETKTWEEIYVRLPYEDNNNIPGRYRHEVAFDGQRIYVFGGGTATTVYGFEVINAFNLETKKWEALVARGDRRMPPPGIPAARRCHGCVQLPPNSEGKNDVFICGGYNGEEIFSDVWKFNLKTLQWTCLNHCPLPRPMYFHSASITPAGQLFTFGGIAALDGETLRIADIFSAWLCIPKLSEIAWEAVTCIHPNLNTVPRRRLLDMGIPLKFVDRLL